MLFNSYEYILAFLPVTVLVFLLLGRSSRPLALEKFSALPDVERYLVIEIHVDGPERRATFESLIEERLGLFQV